MMREFTGASYGPLDKSGETTAATKKATGGRTKGKKTRRTAKETATTANGSSSAAAGSSSRSSGDRPWNQVRKTQKVVNAFGLSDSDLSYLKKNTRYNEQEIKDWYRGFRADCPDGNLHKSKILEMYSMILPAGDSSTFVDQIFRIFDKDGNGSIDFKEFMLATDMTAAGCPEEKLKWAFKLYDKDNSGYIDVSEMAEAIGTLYEMEGLSGIEQNPGMKKARKIFAKLDANGDGELTVEEFVEGCMEDEELLEMLAPTGVPGEGEEEKNE